MKSTSYLLLTIVIITLVSFFGCNTGQNTSSILTRTSPTTSVSGTINLSYSTSMLANVPTYSVERAKVWVEQIPELFALTDFDGKFTINNVPTGIYNIVARSQTGNTVYKMRTNSILASADSDINLQITLQEAKNIVKGVLRTEYGSYLPPLTPLYLWGEKFYVDQNGSFTTPPLPDLGLENALNEIIINFGEPNQTAVSAAFVSFEMPSELEIVVPSTAASVAKLPLVSLIAHTKSEISTEVRANTPIVLEATVYPSDASEIKWSCSDGILESNSRIIQNKHTRQWTSPSTSQKASINLSASSYGRTSYATIFINVIAPQTYSLHYHGNGNTFGSVPTDLNPYEYNDEVTLLDNLNNLQKDGYSFAGWNTSPLGDGMTYQPKTTIRMPDQDLTLYALWHLKPQNKVFYDGNNSTYGIPPIDSNSYAPGDIITLLSNSGSLVKTGYRFSGWNTLANSEGELYQPGKRINMPAENLLLFAHWTPIYTVKYFGNGNTSGEPPKDITVYEEDELVYIIPIGKSFEKTGFTFIGWALSSEGELLYKAGDKIKMPANDLYLFAKWTQNPTYIVEYLGNANTGGSVPIDPNKYEAGEKFLVLSNEHGNLTKAGYRFIGWNTQPDGEGTTHTPLLEYYIKDSSIKLYAKWAKVYTVTYHANGNADVTGSVPLDTLTYLEGEEIIIQANVGSLKKDAHIFEKWNESPDGSANSYYPNEKIKAGTKNINLYAIWKPIPTFFLEYSSNGSDSGAPPTEKNYYFENTSVSLLDNLNNLQKADYVFTCWNTRADGLGKDYYPNETIIINKDFTLFAKWAPTYFLAYHPNGATGPLPSTKRYLSGVEIIVDPSMNLTRTGYTFVNWNTNIAGEGQSYNPGDHFLMGDSNITLYAQWIITPTYKFKYDSNLADSGTLPAEESYFAGTEIRIIPQGDLLRRGYYFIGWSAQADAQQASYVANDTLLMPAEDLTLYAVWQAMPTYSLTFKANAVVTGLPPEKVTFYEGQMLTLPDNGTMQRSGYQFVAWNTKSDLTGTEYQAGSKLAMPPNDLELYAVWLALPTFSITYHPNGATGNEPPSTRHIAGASVAMPNANTLAKENFIFDSWCLDLNGNGTLYKEGDAFIMPDYDVIMFAQWKPDYTTLHVTSISPSDGSKNLPTNTEVVIAFSEPVDKSSAESAIFFNTGFTGTWQWDSNKVLRFVPSSNWFPGSYQTITVPANQIKNLDLSKTLMISMQSSFELAPDFSLPSDFKSAAFPVLMPVGQTFSTIITGLETSKILYAIVVGDNLDSDFEVMASIEQLPSAPPKKCSSSAFRFYENLIQPSSNSQPSQNSPSLSVTEGELFDFFIAPDAAPPHAIDNKIQGICKTITDNAYFYFDTQVTDPTELSSLTNIANELATAWENNILPKMTSNFAAPPPADSIPDSDPKLTFLFVKNLKINSYFFGGDLSFEYGTSSDGGQISNGRKIIYLNSTPNSQIELNALVAAEYQHLISYYHNYILNNLHEATWLNEALSSYSHFVCGYGIEDGNITDTSLIQSTLTSLENASLTTWNYTDSTLNLGLGQLFIRYIAQPSRYKSTSAQVTTALITSPFTGVSNIESLTKEPFYKTLAKFYISLLLNRHDSYLSDDYGIKGFDINATYNGIQLPGVPVTLLSTSKITTNVKNRGVKYFKKVSDGSIINIQFANFTNSARVFLLDQR